MPYFNEQHFQNLTASDILSGEYDSCTFSTCNFSGASFQKVSFENCKFEDCDLSNIKVPKVDFQNPPKKIDFPPLSIAGSGFFAGKS